jgi:hypothetical protein
MSVSQVSQTGVTSSVSQNTQLQTEFDDIVIPNKCLSKIVKFCIPHLIENREDFRDLRNLRLVSKRWEQLVLAAKKSIKFKASMDTRTIDLMIQKNPNLESVFFVFCTQITDGTIEALTKSRRLSHLSLAWCPQIRDENVVALASHLKLRTLNLTACTQISDAVIRSSFSEHPTLKYLILARCTQITNETVIALFKNLDSVNLSFCDQINVDSLLTQNSQISLEQ